MNQFLSASFYIDSHHPSIINQALALTEHLKDDEEKVKACFEFVRDEIRHSNDYQLNPITCAASDVLKHKTGYCYAKSHLLAALLRSIKIPSGLCYQRLTIDDEKPPYCLHGLNAVYLQQYGWYRIDPRGNKKGIDAQFSPPQEKLAFALCVEGEMNLKEIYSEPLKEVIHVLTTYKTYSDVLKNLPDFIEK